MPKATGTDAESTVTLTDEQVASSLIVQPDAGAKAIPPQGNEASDAAADDSQDEQQEETVEDIDGEADAEQQEADGASDEDEDEDEQDQDEGGEPEYVDIRDDDLIEVTVDGETRELTIKELKAAYSAEGAIEKRLQEATETRKVAHSERTQILEALYGQEQVLTAALSSFDDNLFKAVIPPPPAELKARDPARYLAHQEAYNQDQARIAEAKKTVASTLDKLNKQREDRLKAYATDAGKVIAREIPELTHKDAVVRTAKLTELTSVAKAYGYTDQEIQSAIDPRLFVIMRDLAAFSKIKSKANGIRTQGVATIVAQSNETKVRKLRSGATTAKKVVRSKQKEQQAIARRARDTGKVNDVAATLIRK